MKLNTLRARVVTWYVGLLAAVLILFGAALYLGVKSYLKASLQRSLSGEADAIANTLVAFEEKKGAEWMAGEIGEAYAPEISGRFIRVSRQDGKVLYQSGDTRDPVIDASQVSHVSTESAEKPFRTETPVGSSRLLIHTLPFTSSSGTKYWIETGASLAPLQRVLSSLLRIVVLLTPLILVAATIGGSMFMRVPLQPLVTLAERAEHIGTAALGERLPVTPTGDEMERLALSLNRMITRLEESLSLNRRFSADVSHELRTPLTIMRGELEHVLREPELQASIRSSVVSALEEISRMTKIVNSLLTIARLDSGTDSIEAQPADVSELCRWTVDQMRLLAEEKEISLQVQTVPVTALIDTARMKQVLVNLIDNAIKYTPSHGRVLVKSSLVNETAVIEICDDGRGISEEALPHVFNRFFRVDKGRARISGGTGLGLSIVKAICHAHGGTIALHSKQAEGTTVRVELPALSPAVAAPRSVIEDDVLISR